CFSASGALCVLHTFPTRRSADLVPYKDTDRMGVVHHGNYINWFEIARTECMRHYGIAYSYVEKRGFLLPVLKVECDYKKSATFEDRKSTRLNSSHVSISYAVFCL